MEQVTHGNYDTWGEYDSSQAFSDLKKNIYILGYQLFIIFIVSLGHFTISSNH